MTWMNGVFSPDLAFGATAFDSIGEHAAQNGSTPIPGGDPLRAGWIWRNGQYSPVVAITKRTQRNPTSLYPKSVEMSITDGTGYVMALRGTILAAAGWRAWQNMDSIICLVRWECEEGVCHGDFQDVHMHDWVYNALRDDR